MHGRSRAILGVGYQAPKKHRQPLFHCPHRVCAPRALSPRWQSEGVVCVLVSMFLLWVRRSAPATPPYLGRQAVSARRRSPLIVPQCTPALRDPVPILSSRTRVACRPAPPLPKWPAAAFSRAESVVQLPPYPRSRTDQIIPLSACARGCSAPPAPCVARLRRPAQRHMVEHARTGVWVMSSPRCPAQEGHKSSFSPCAPTGNSATRRPHHFWADAGGAPSRVHYAHALTFFPPLLGPQKTLTGAG